MLALELTDPEKSQHGLILLSDRGAALIIDRVWGRLARSRPGYLSSLRPSARLAESLSASLADLQLAGLEKQSISLEHFETRAKGQELVELMEAYRQEVCKLGRMDYPDVLRLAIRQLRDDLHILGDDVLVLLPDNLDCSALEKDLLLALPAKKKRSLPVDEPGILPMPPASDNSETSMLRWVLSPSEAPSPAGDGSATLFRAVGESNEVREVLRRCLAARIPLDNVEILYTDGDTYIPLIYECLLRLQPEEQVLEEPPVTFSEGLPARYSRPGRALALWLAWQRDGFPQRILGQLIQEGLLEIPWKEGAQPSFDRLAALLRTLGIGFGRDRYLAMIEERLAAPEPIDNPADENEDSEAMTRRKTARRQHRLGLQTLQELVETLLAGLPEAGAGQQSVLRAARLFLEKHARTASELDSFARQKLCEEIEDLEYWLGLDDQPVSMDVWEWLTLLPMQARVKASNPRPGCLHAAPVLSGGHSGRTHTFVVGLDDSRFPGAGLQDPLLLDSERCQLSGGLRTAAQRLTDKQQGLARTLARLRGQVTLSFSCRNLVDNREMFPSSVVLAAYRILSGNRETSLGDMLRDLPAAASFAPNSAPKCMDVAEWWTWRQCGPDPVPDAQVVMGHHYPHLQRGFFAAQERANTAFTIYDGRVEQAGRDLDPTKMDGPVLTTSRLETLGRCPLAYFFQHVLGLDVRPDYEEIPSWWLDSAAAGALLHETFELMMCELCQDGRQPELARDWPRLQELLGRGIEKYRRLYPCPSQAVFERQCRELRRTAHVFLLEEEDHCRSTGSRPAYLEASLGMPTLGHGTALDTTEPIELSLPNGDRIRVRGRVDRIDQLENAQPPTYAVWDYKTGSSRKYNQADPFQEGRRIQNFIYLEMVASRLRQVISPEARLESFGYFFPSSRGHGERICWKAEELSDGREVLKHLIALLKAGVFPATNQKDDCLYCNVRGTCGDVAATVSASASKLAGPDSELLMPFQELRAND
jgi:ATP-dependent helicase/nuclease subunit B